MENFIMNENEAPTAPAQGTATLAFPETMETQRSNFLESLKIRNYSPATIGSRSCSLDVFFRYLMSMALDDVREVHRDTVRDYQAFLLGKYKTCSVHIHIIALRRFFEHLESTDAVLVNPCAGILLPKLEDRLPRNVLTPGEAQALLDAPDTQHPKGIRDKAILETFYSTGIRLEEMEHLTIYDVDCKQGFVRVNKGKFAKDRIVPLGTKAADYIREYMQKVRAEWIKDNRDERALWLSWRWPHQPLKKQLIGVMVRRYGRAAQIQKKVSPHVWRHTCATHLVGNGSNIAYVQRLLGHRSLTTTQIYTRVAVPEVIETARTKHPRQAQTQGDAAQAPAPPTERIRSKYQYKSAAAKIVCPTLDH
jgi:integrase/recombinase XerD